MTSTAPEPDSVRNERTFRVTATTEGRSTTSRLYRQRRYLKTRPDQQYMAAAAAATTTDNGRARMCLQPPASMRTRYHCERGRRPSRSIRIPSRVSPAAIGPEHTPLRYLVASSGDTSHGSSPCVETGNSHSRQRTTRTVTL